MKTLAVAAPGATRCGITDYAAFLGKSLQADWQLLEIQLPASDSPRAWRNAAGQADPADLALIHYEYNLFRSVKPGRNLFARFMQRLKPPAIVILHDLLPELTPCRQARKPYRLRVALRDLAYLPFFSTWSKTLYGLADRFIVHAPHLAARARSRAPGVDVSFLPHPIPPTSRQWHIAQSKTYTFITPGFIKEHKGYLDFLDVVQSRPQWNWQIAGGPQNATDQQFVVHLHARITEMDLADRVTISGYRSREGMEEMMAGAELAVFPYRRVTGSGAAAWAVGMGMPVIATDRETFRDLVRAGGGLALLPGGKPEHWAELAGGLLADPERRRRLANANSRFSALHGYDETAGHITAIAAALLAQANTPGTKRR